MINEIESDTFNSPLGTDYAEFIELYSLTGTTTPLDGLTLVLFNGGAGATAADVSYRAIDLDGLSTDSRGYYVFGTTRILRRDGASRQRKPRSGCTARIRAIRLLSP